MINWFCHMYPYGNLHELNLDWVIDTVKQGEKEIADFIGVNTIKYANPILWNITSQYEANTVVVDGQTGNAYISVKAVPSGVHLNREEYWTQIYNYADVVNTLREQVAYNEGESTTATRPYTIDNLVFVNGVLYRVIAPMIAGDSFVADSNVVQTTINAEILRVHGFISDVQDNIDAEASARESADDTLQANIEAEASARESADDTLQANIEAEASTRESADDTLQANIEAEASARDNADDTLQANINSVDSKIGNLSDLSTTDKSDVVHAINEVLSYTGNPVNDNLRYKKVLVVGDSISDLSNFPNCWVKYLKEVPDITVDVLAINGGAFSGSGGIAEAFINRTVQTYDYIIFEVGVNDWGAQLSLGNYSSNTINTFMGSINLAINKCRSSYSNSKVFWITPLPTFFDESLVSSRKVALNMYRSAIYYLASYYKNYIIDGACGIPNYRDSLTLDHIHPNSDGAQLLNELVKNNLYIPSNQIGDIWDYFDFAPTTTGLTGSVRVLVNCHGDIIFRINVNVTTQPTANSFIILSNDSAWAEYLGTSIPYFPIVYQGQTSVSNGVLAWSTSGLQASSPISQIGRFIGDIVISSNLMSAPSIQN